MRAHAQLMTHDQKIYVRLNKRTKKGITSTFIIKVVNDLIPIVVVPDKLFVVLIS